VLSPADREHYIAKMYAAAFAAGKITPALIAADTNLALYVTEISMHSRPIRRGATMLRPAAPAARASTMAQPFTKLDPPPSPMEALLLATYPVNDDQLESLAARRAQAVQTYLLQTGKVDAARLFLTATGAGNVRRDGSRAYLQFR